MRTLLATARIGLVQRFRRVRTDAEIAARAFDRAFYLATQADVAAAGLDPFEHFMDFGWREGRDPAPDFSVTGYLACYPQVAALGVNPFVHYLTNGRPRILPPEPPLGFRHRVIEHLASLDERIAAATAKLVEPSPQSVLATALARSREGLRRLHVTFSHDDFTANLGGLQLSLGREAARLAELGRDHLHLYPAKPWPVVRTMAEPDLLGVVWNGAQVGLFAPADIAGALGAAVGPDEGRGFASTACWATRPTRPPTSWRRPASTPGPSGCTTSPASARASTCCATTCRTAAPRQRAAPPVASASTAVAVRDM